MITDDLVPIALDRRERHILMDISLSLHDRACEGMRVANTPSDLVAAATRARAVAHMLALAEGEPGLPTEDLVAIHSDLLRFSEETEATTTEHDLQISEGDKNNTVSDLRRLIAVDHAQDRVCMNIVDQIDEVTA